MYKRPIFDTLIKRFSDERKFIQVLSGPRQTGKTTLAHQIMESISLPTHYVTADEPSLSGIETFSNLFGVEKKLLVGGDGIPLHEFLSFPVEALFNS